MEPKRSKYDTNPLEEEVAAHADQSFGAVRPTGQTDAGPTHNIGRATREPVRLNPEREASTYNGRPARDPESEAPTRRIDDNIVTSYPSVFVPPQQRPPTYQSPRIAVENVYQPPPARPPAVYQPPQLPTIRPGRNIVNGLGIPEKWAVALPYLPFYLAVLIAIVELVLVPRTESRVRFHASQALTIQLGITVISILLTLGGMISSRYTGAGLFTFATSILLVISMIRVWKGKPVVIPPLEEARKWFDEKIRPRK
jgi:uncharacterized membrane protein